MTQTIPVNSAEISISTCFAEEADKLEDLKKHFQVHNHLFTLLSSDDVEGMINWFDGRPKTMYLSLWTTNKAAIQYAFSEGLLDQDSTIGSAIRDHLECQGLSGQTIEEMMNKFITPKLSLKQGEDGRLFVDPCDCSPA